MPTSRPSRAACRNGSPASRCALPKAPGWAFRPGESMTEPSRHQVSMRTLQEVRAIHDLPLTELVFRAQTVHRQHHQPDSVQLCTLLSIKTGGCPEDCGYCSQSARHETKMEAQPLMDE